jgi:type I pantothenate kinase
MNKPIDPPTSAIFDPLSVERRGDRSKRDRQTSLFTTFSREAWSTLGKDRIELPVAEVLALQGAGEPTSPSDIDEIFGPLCRLIRLHVEASRSLTDRIAGSFLKQASTPRPYIVGVAGSVAVGKSTFARLLRTLLARHSNAWRVELVATDGFLFPTMILEARGLMGRKGFPESYDLRLYRCRPCSA